MHCAERHKLSSVIFKAASISLISFFAYLPAQSAEVSQSCLGATVDQCIASLGKAFRLTDAESVRKQMVKNEEKDVNGKSTHPRKILVLSGKFAGFPRAPFRTLNIEYSIDHIVTNIEMSLPSNPASAKTTEDYAKTGIYEAIILMAGKNCVENGRDDLYKFFENTVKPNIIHEEKSVENSPTGISTNYFSKALNIPFCGHLFSYNDLFGYDTEQVSLDNPHGSFSIVLISLK